jgi:PAS domain S-box-containing protein
MPTPLKVLIAEDLPDDADMMVRELRRAGFTPTWKRVETEPDFLAELINNAPDLILSDYAMPQFSGLRAAELTRASGLDIPFILISGTLGEETAVEALKNGATDYLLKDRMTRLGLAVGRALSEQRLRDERRRADEKLRENEADLAEAQRVAKMGSWHYDTASKKVRWSDELCRIFGFEKAQFDSKYETFLDCVLPDERPKVLQANDEAMTRGTAFEVEYHIQTRAGTLKTVREIGYATKDANGGVVSLFGTAQDITERKQAEDELRESEEKFRQIAATINEVFWMTDAVKLQMLYISPAYEKIWGRTCESLYEAPQTWVDAIHPEDRKRVLKAAMTKQTSGEYDEIYRIIRPDGSERWIHDHALPLRNAAGEVFRIVGTAEDITENRKLEAQFRQAQKMESIGQLAGGIAHDFNNILSAIVGNLSLAKLESEEIPAIAEYLDEISNATRRATDLVNQILTFSRQNKQERSPIHLNHVVLEALKLLRASMPSTIKIQSELAQTPTVLANATAIHQVVMNLGTNAWHAMRDNPGTLKVEVNIMEVDDEFVKVHPGLRAGKHVRLSASDTGCGMDHATLERIFDPFFTTKPIGEGTGLGLAVVHGIMKNHDGGIFAHSRPGEGTTFHLYFPVLETEAVAPQIGSSPIPRGNGEHILFVDDEAALANVGKKILERLGYSVTVKTSALEAIAAVEAQPDGFDLVVTDLTMPVMDGAKLGDRLLQIQPRLPIILMTGYSGSMTTEKINELGFSELLDKPNTARTLGETVHRVLHQETAIGINSGALR